MKTSLMLVAFVYCALVCSGVFAQERSVVFEKILQKLRRPPFSQPTAQETAEIQRLIDGLANVDNLDFADVFLPTGVRLGWGPSRAPAEPNASPDLQRLVAFGPKALPLLIDSLTNTAATKIFFKDDGRGLRLEKDEQRLSEYTVTVGDICYMIIGQIVSRKHRILHDDASGIVVVTSVANERDLRNHLEANWGGPDSGNQLFESLLADFLKEGNGDDLKSWHEVSDFQAHAAMRLLYYFPRESTQLIAQRIDELDVSEVHPPYSLPALAARAKENYGVHADQLVKAVAWCQAPDIHGAILRTFSRATNVDVIVACLPSIRQRIPDQVSERLSKIISKLPVEEPPFGADPQGNEYELLVGLEECAGADAKPVFERYLESKGIARSITMCYVLRKIRQEWAADLLAPLLDDQRIIPDGTYAVDGADGKSRLPLRVCDEVATTIALANKNVKFILKGTHAELDQQIETMKQTLSR